MRKSIISAILLVGLLSTLPAQANDIALRSDTPDQHIVVPGDTLWGIAAKFLEDPWRWPEIWGFNKEQVKNPHRIYPGDIVELELTPHGMRLRIADNKASVKLSPKIRTEKSGTTAIPSIPATAIEPFLSQPVVIDREKLVYAPYILGSSDGRVVLGKSHPTYVKDLPTDQGDAWQIFRPGKALRDPDADNQILGYEATYLGDLKISAFDKISTAQITLAKQEILKGDRLIVSPDLIFNNYAPHAPSHLISGRIISVYGGVTEIGKGSIITLNKGARDGLAMGHVLGIYRRSHARTLERQHVQLPDERTGLVFVFRVFDKISYALVMQSTNSIKMLDAVKSPQPYKATD